MAAVPFGPLGSTGAAPQGSTSRREGRTRLHRGSFRSGGTNDNRSTGAPAGVVAEFSHSLGSTAAPTRRELLPEWLLDLRPTRLRRDCLNGAGLGFGVGLDPKGFPQTPSQKRFFAALGTYSAHFVRCRRVKSKSPSPKKPVQEGEIKSI